MSRRCVVTCCSLQGQRSENEDLAIVESAGDWTFCLVVDGIGGRGAGCLASREAGSTIAGVLRRQLPMLSEKEPVGECLTAALRQAHDALAATNIKRSSPPFGACTAAVAALSAVDGLAILTHVGQPFAFQTRGRTGTRLFRDHAAELIQEGRRQGRWVDPIFPVLGMAGYVAEVDCLSIAVESGDFLALCSDGIGVLSPEQIAACLIAQSPLESEAERLCRLALARGCRDNVSAVVIQRIHEH